MLSVVSISILFGVAIAWEVDDRCPDPPSLRHLFQNNIDDADMASEPSLSPYLRGTNDNRHLLSSFQLKMFWQEGYCWQEEWIERKWCMSCQGKKCTPGERLWLQFCDAGQVTQQFYYLPVANTGNGQLKTASENLCLERISDEVFKLYECKTTNRENQLFVGIKTDGSRFELSPKGRTDKCLANLEHFPKGGELIYSTNCKAARIVHTSQWTSYHGGSESIQNTASDATNSKLRKTKCSAKKPCDACQGECDIDNDCKGDLKCFQRTGSEKIPGCFGSGTAGSDYCYQVSASFTSASTSSLTSSLTSSSVINNIFGRLRAPGCSKDRPCGVCQGDCDNNDECAGNLICKLKDGPGDVQGCSGYDPSNTDFCVPP